MLFKSVMLVFYFLFYSEENGYKNRIKKVFDRCLCVAYKGLQKLGIVILLLLISLTFAAASFALTKGNSLANVAYTLVTTDETGTGVVYTPQCLSECHLPMKFLYNGSIAPPTIPINVAAKNNINWMFSKTNASDDIDITDIKILKTFLFNETIQLFSSVTTISPVPANSTIPPGCLQINDTHYSCQSIIPNGTLTIEKTTSQWESIFNKPIMLNKNEHFYLDFIGKRTASTGFKASDLLPTIFGFQLPEFAWWNSSYNNRVQINLTMIGTTNLRNFTLNVTMNTTAGKGFQADCDDLRFINEDNSTELIYRFEDINSTIFGCTTANTQVWVEVPTIRPANNTALYYYFNNSAATSPSYGIAFSDLLLHLPLAYNSSFITPDISGYTHNAQIQSGGTLTHNNSFYGKGLVFVTAVSGNYANISNTGTLNIGATSDSYTVMSWAKTNSAGTKRRIINKENTKNPYALAISAAEKGSFEIYDGTANPSTTGTTNINTDSWFHVAGVRDTTADLLRIYINGKEEGNATDTTTISVADSIEIKIGKHPGNVQLWLGSIDDIRIYNRTLTPDEINNIYLNGLSRIINPVETTPVETTARPDAASTLTPTTAFRNTQLYANGTLTDTDTASGLKIWWQLYNGSAVYASGNTTTDRSSGTQYNLYNLSANIARKNEVWRFEVKGDDGTNGTATNSTAVTISNTAPVINFVNATINNVGASGTDIRLQINTTENIDSDLNRCKIVDGLTGISIANDVCVIDIGDALINSSITIEVNDTSNGTVSRIISINVSFAIDTNVLDESPIRVGITHNITTDLNLTTNGIGLNDTNVNAYLTSFLGNMTNTSVGFWNLTGIASNSSRLLEFNGTVLAVNESLATSCSSANLVGITRYTCTSNLTVRHPNVDALNTTYNVSNSVLTNWALRFVNTEVTRISDNSSNVSGTYLSTGADIAILNGFVFSGGIYKVDIIYDIPIQAEGGAPPGGGGGSSGTPLVPSACGDFSFRPSSKITGYGIPGTNIAPFEIFVRNEGNLSQVFSIDFSVGLESLCTAEPVSSEPLAKNGAVKFMVTCKAPGNQTIGNIRIVPTEVTCAEDIPTELVPSAGLLFGFTEFVRLMATGNLAAAFLVNVAFLPIILWFIIIGAIGIAFWKL